MPANGQSRRKTVDAAVQSIIKNDREESKTTIIRQIREKTILYSHPISTTTGEATSGLAVIEIVQKAISEGYFGDNKLIQVRGTPHNTTRNLPKPSPRMTSTPRARKKAARSSRRPDPYGLHLTISLDPGLRRSKTTAHLYIAPMAGAPSTSYGIRGITVERSGKRILDTMAPKPLEDVLEEVLDKEPAGSHRTTKGGE
ncbi:hypothetical protein MIND_00527000 [Mycena indigotica]|uniref:Uncharacterized protein n=1 Tax=Mycena indigotica TaxID=2126181 RepID=A0A8H6T0P6_9AGAR|nr:uncharacterized protein MIND_00527000 [Mycena indigotica]KAF7307330.1 hypothetical protein MIND_00527000 [Mycena indigotica]